MDEDFQRLVNTQDLVVAVSQQDTLVFEYKGHIKGTSFHFVIDLDEIFPKGQPSPNQLHSGCAKAIAKLHPRIDTAGLTKVVVDDLVSHFDDTDLAYQREIEKAKQFWDQVHIMRVQDWFKKEKRHQNGPCEEQYMRAYFTGRLQQLEPKGSDCLMDDTKRKEILSWISDHGYLQPSWVGPKDPQQNEKALAYFASKVEQETVAHRRSLVQTDMTQWYEWLTPQEQKQIEPQLHRFGLQLDRGWLDRPKY